MRRYALIVFVAAVVVACSEQGQPTFAPGAVVTSTDTAMVTSSRKRLRTRHQSTFYTNFDSASPGAIAPGFSDDPPHDWQVYKAAAGTITNTLPNYFGVGSAGALQSDTMWYSQQYTSNSFEEEFSFVPATTWNNAVDAAIHGTGTSYFSISVTNGDVAHWDNPSGGFTSLPTAGGSQEQIAGTSFNPFTIYCAKVLFQDQGSNYSIQEKVWQCGATEPAYGSPVLISESQYPMSPFTGGIRANNGVSPNYMEIDDFGLAYDGAVLPPIPTPVPTSPLTPFPAMHVTNAPWDPPAGTFPYFSQSVFQVPLSNPVPDPSSSSWLASEASSNGGVINLGYFQFAANASGSTNDFGFPVYQEPNSGRGYYVHCMATYSCGTAPYNAEGQTVYLTGRMGPEQWDYTSGTCTIGNDCHLAVIDTTNNVEIDLFGVNQFPPSGKVLNVHSAGVMPFTGLGYPSATITRGCGATATNNCQTQGLLRASDLLNILNTPNGALPTALAISVNCDIGTDAPPFIGLSDGMCMGGPPEGVRIYCNMTDDDIDGTPLIKIGKAILRSLDVQHYGGIVTYTNGSMTGDGVIGLQAENDLTYEAPYTKGFGTGPFATSFLAEYANEESPAPAPTADIHGDYKFQVPIPASMLDSCLNIAMKGSQQ